MTKRGQPPFKEGDLICLTGPGIIDGLHIYRAGKPVLIDGRWCNGYRPWGVDGNNVELGYATIKDVDRKIEILSSELRRTMEELKTILEFRAKLTEES